MTAHIAKQTPKLVRQQAWRAIVVSVTNEALRRGLFRPALRRPVDAAPPTRLTTAVTVSGRTFSLDITDTCDGQIGFMLLADAQIEGRCARANWILEQGARRRAASVTVPKRIDYTWFSGFSTVRMFALSQMKTEPVGYAIATLPGEADHGR